jgi:hypothetical protein
MNYARSSLPFAALAIAALVGFWPHYLAVGGLGFAPLAHVHAVTMMLWLALLIVQPVLIHTGRRAAHRQIGRVAWLLAPLIVASSLVLAWRMTAPAAGAAIEAFRYGLFFVQIATTVLFAACVAGALAWRKDTALHARCMAAAGLTCIDPTLARVVSNFAPAPLQQVDWASAALAVLIAAALALADRRAARGAWVLPLLTVLLAAITIAGLTIGNWPPWRGLIEALLLG